MSPSAILFSYAIGLIFTVGGIVFLIGLDDNRLLFGIPYLLIGLLILFGVRASQRRVARRALAEEGGGQDGGGSDRDG